MTFKHFLISAFVFLSFCSFGQAKLRKADDHFAKLEYYASAPIYADLAKKTIQGKGTVNWDIVRKAAISYKQLFQYNRSRYFYSKLHETNHMTESDFVEYIDLLRTIGKYDVADELLTDAIKVYPSNNFVVALKDKNKEFGYLLKDSSVYSINPLSINSGLGDFCPAFFEQGIMYMSKAKNAGFLNQKYGWDNSYFINMLYSPYDADSTLKNGKVLKDAFFSRAHDGPVSFSPDGTKMVITKNTLGKHNDKEIVVLAIYFSEKKEGEWKESTPFPFNNPAYNVGHACFNEAGNRIYFASDQPNGLGGADLYYSDLVNGSWGTPVNLGSNINTEQDELFPFVSNSTLYFSSKGHFGIGGLDIFTVPVTLSGAPVNMGYPINTSFDDFGIIALKDDKSGFFSSNRGDFVDRIYDWKRKEPIISIEGGLYASYATNEPFPAHYILKTDLTENYSDTIYTDSLGLFTAPLKFGHSYSFVSNEAYFELEAPLEIQTSGFVKDTILHGDLFLKPTTIMVSLRVLERDSKRVISGAKTTVSNPLTKMDTVLVTNKEGMVTLRVDRFTSYTAHAAKRGYVDDEAKFTTESKTDKVIDLVLQLPLIKKGDKFKLENIFYDYNKSTLRPESKEALDKLALFIIDNALKIELSSHTDSRGSNEANQKLSQRRAQSCVDYLLTKGVKPSSIVAKGYGEAQLLNKCKDGVVCSEVDHQLNRRTEIKIL